MHSVFSRCKHIRLLLHQSDTLLRLSCNVTSISFTVFPLVSRDESSANREFLTFFVLYVQWQIIYEYTKKQRSGNTALLNT